MRVAYNKYSRRFDFSCATDIRAGLIGMYCLLGGQLFVLRGLSCLWRGLGYSSLEYDLSDIARQGVYLYYRDYVDVRRGFPIASCELCTGVDTGEDDAALPLLCPVHQ